MKAFPIGLLLLLIASVSAVGQTPDNSLNHKGPRATLDTDLTFQQALKEIKYPAIQRLVRKTTIVFVNFTLDQQGKVTNINYLNENEVDHPFVNEVRRLFWHFPTQKPTYAGEYVLPVSFEKVSMPGEKRNFVIQEKRAAYTPIIVPLSPSLAFRPKVMLSEVCVTASN